MYIHAGTDAEGYYEIKVEVDSVNLKVRSRPGCCREGPEN
jgi:hypothetical protein